MPVTNNEQNQVNADDIESITNEVESTPIIEEENKADENNEDIAADTATEAPSATDELAKACQEASDHWEKYLRTHAELENLRKRHDKDIEKAHKYSIEQFCKDILQVKDSMELGLQATIDAESKDTEELIKGFQLTLKMLNQTFAKYFIKEINPTGEKFNPELHQAMTMQASDSIENDHVITVFQKGYTLNDRLIRPALVVVAQN